MACNCSYDYEVHEKIKGTRKRYNKFFGNSSGPGPKCDVAPQFNPEPYTKIISQKPTEGIKDEKEQKLEEKTVPENASEACSNCGCECTAGETTQNPERPEWKTVKEYTEKITVKFDSRVKYTLAGTKRDDSCGTFEEEHEVDVVDQETEYTKVTPYSCKCTCE